ncbi:MAG: ATP-binding protein [Mangrovibacterium sp.]
MPTIKDKKMRNKEVTICACISRSFIDKRHVALLAAEFRKNDYHVNIVGDLCEMVMTQSPELAGIANTNILACYPRTIQSQMDWLGLKAENIGDIRNNDLSAVLAQFNLCPSATNESETPQAVNEEINALPASPGADAWYPLLDKSRCTNCGKCHDFCLFGVYTLENKEVKVVQPQNCKNNCPACARVCPSKAIIFPKYAKSPINGGTTDEEEFDPESLDKMYQERLRYRLRQRREGISLLKTTTK